MCVIKTTTSDHLLLGFHVIASLTDRVKRLKDARTEADEEIESYRKSKDQEFSAFQSSVSSVRVASAHSLT